MKMFKRFAAALLAGVMVLAMLTACGGGAGGPGESEFEKKVQDVYMAALNKEYGTTFAWILAAVGIRFWTLFRLDGGSHKDEMLLLIMFLVPVTLGYAWVRWLKKTGRLEEEDFSTVDA